MKIRELSVNNFRSIKNITLNPAELCALIGPNSCGKTNILKAIDLVLGEGWTTKAKVARELFNDTNQDIKIKIDFTESIEWHYYAQRKDINCITLVMQYQPLDCKVRLWESYPNDKNGEGYYVNDEFKKKCHFVYISSERQLTSELRVSKWTMLGKLMKLIYENYITHYGNNENSLKHDFAEKIKPAKNFLESDFSSNDITFKKFEYTFKKYCSLNSSGLASEFMPLLDIYNLNWFYKTLQIHVKEDLPDKHFDSEEVGAGMQNLLMISIFQTYAELMGGKVIFGVEEPEMYLYPQAQRALYKNLIGLSANTQMLYTTHNQNFVDAARPDDIVLLRKNTVKGTYNLQKDDYFNMDNAAKQKYKIYTHFNTERNELFFAKKVLLVEGDSDKILFSALCEEKWKIDLDSAGISIISCGGKGGIVYFIGVCKIIGLEAIFSVWDKDEEVDDNAIFDEVKEKKKGLELDPNLEGFLGLPEGVSALKVKNAFEWAMNVKSEDIPKEFNDIKDFFLNRT